MRITKKQLNEMVREAIQKSLEEDAALPSAAPSDPGAKGMTNDELSMHLSGERKRKKRKDLQRRRADMKKATRGMELEGSSGVQVADVMLDVLRDSGMSDTDILSQLIASLDDQAVRTALGALVSQAQGE